ncbi:MAG: glycoside hydrolase family 6 protein [Polyangiaceae bacterium]
MKPISNVVAVLATLAALGVSVSCGAAKPKHASGPDAAQVATAARKPGANKQLGENPFAGAKYYINPYGNAVVHAKAARRLGKTDEAALLDKISAYGGAECVGDWIPYVERWVTATTTNMQEQGALPLYVAYNLPGRDCGQYSAGGAKTGDAYKTWISGFARGIGARKAVIILEPDALGLLTKCLTGEEQNLRLSLMRYAVESFNALPHTFVYIDAGHSAWLPVQEAASRLKAAGIEQAQGFALNVSNFRANDELIEYGKQISALVGDKHFVLDTSRNGNGPITTSDSGSEATWCNPPGRALGSPPTSRTADPLCDAYLWLKKPGESDGTCNGGPKAGTFWTEQALELARNAKF